MIKLDLKKKIVLWYLLCTLMIITLITTTLCWVTTEIYRSDQEQKLSKEINILEENLTLTNMKKLTFFQHGTVISVFDDQFHKLAGQEIETLEGQEFISDKGRIITSSDDTSWMVYDRNIIKDGQSYWIRGVKSGNVVELLHNKGINAYLWLVPVLGAISMGISWWMTQKTLVPVREIQQMADSIYSGSDLSKRLNLPHTNDEIHRLAETFNKMFVRLEGSFLAEKRFISEASHELRTPITVIQAHAEYGLEKDLPESERRETLTEIKKQAEKLGSLVAQLFALVRGDNFHGTFKPVDMEEVVTLVATDLLPMIQSKKQQLYLQCERDLQVLGDFSLLTSLVTNLVSNAIRYGKEQGHIDIKLSSEDNFVCLSVADDGIGISAEDLSYIWQRFYQSDVSHSDNQGTGLGLAIVKQIVDLHGGSVSVTSKLGKGSAFTMKITRIS